MLYLKKLSLAQFKNYPSSAFSFNERIIGICGLNGKGKTNLLDAVNYLCFTKSYFTKSDALTVQFGSDGFRLEGDFICGGETHEQKVVCIYRNSKKELYLNDSPYEKFSAHIGKFPCVMIAPDDVEIITGGSEERRKFIDTVLSQMDPGYLQQLILYNKVLLQRNSLLKRFAEQGNVDWNLLEVLDTQLVQPGIQIHTRRNSFTAQLIPVVSNFYKEIAGNDEMVTLNYESQLNENNFNDLLHKCRERDLILQRSNTGIHKDDLGILIDGRIFKNIASQGQRKSLLFALKLAEFEILKKAKSFAPLLLLDDVFEKLDDDRMNNLLQWVSKNNGQVFITDTHRERLAASFRNGGNAIQIVELS
ncbi:MAG: DNA replication and repair protein RecF [Ginsengibacter sp.]